jgi:hypothetical protein
MDLIPFGLDIKANKDNNDYECKHVHPKTTSHFGANVIEITASTQR